MLDFDNQIDNELDNTMRYLGATACMNIFGRSASRLMALTIATALDRLARTKRIWAFELHGRRHYGAKSAKAGVIRTYEDLPKEQRDEARFNPEFTFPDNNLAT